MRRSTVLCLAIFVSMLLSSSTSFAKVCHPKKPLTCTATHLVQAPAPAVVAAPVKKTTQVTTHQPKVQHAMACGPWVKWICTAQPGLI